MYLAHSADLPYSKALGITDDVERLSLKGSRKKKGKKLDEDFVVSFLARLIDVK